MRYFPGMSFWQYKALKEREERLEEIRKKNRDNAK